MAAARTLGTTRRGFLGGAVATAAVLTASACGANSTAASTSVHQRRVSSVNGMIAVPNGPFRAIALDAFTLTSMLDLGRPPIAVYGVAEQDVPPQYRAAWQSLQQIADGDTVGQPDGKQIRGLNPNLVVGVESQHVPYTKFQRYAPTVIVPFSTSLAPWRDVATAIATVLDRPKALAALDQEYQTRTAAIRKKYARRLAKAKWNLIEGIPGKQQFALYGPSSPAGGILAAAGVRFAPASASVTRAPGRKLLPYKRLQTLNKGGALLYTTTATDHLTTHQAFKSLTAVTTNHAFTTPTLTPTGYSTAEALLNTLEKALQHLH